MGSTALPGTWRWRRRWAALDDDVREQIVLHVDAGQPLTDPRRAALAVVLARRRRQDAIAAMAAAPALTILAVAVGAAFGRATRGGAPLEALVTFLTWAGGTVWIASAAATSALLLAISRSWLARLRRAERANRAVVDGYLAGPPAGSRHDGGADARGSAVDRVERCES